MYSHANNQPTANFAALIIVDSKANEYLRKEMNNIIAKTQYGMYCMLCILADFK